MKAKNQPPMTSEIEAKEKLIVFVYEYLTHSGAKRAAQAFLEDIHYEKEIQLTQEAPGFLFNWWSVFWDLYCATPEKRNQPEPSHEARAFHEFTMRPIMSPSCLQASPPQQGPPFMGGLMTGTRFGPHPATIRGSPVNLGSRVQNMNQGPPPQMNVPHPSMMGAGSPRYSAHPGHMTPGSSSSAGPMGSEPGPSPGLNRMTPNHSSSPHPQVGQPNGMGGPPSHGGPPHGQGGGGPIQQMQRGGPPPGWQNNFNMNSPASQQCFIPATSVPSNQQGEFGGMIMNDGRMMEVKSSGNNNGPSNQHQDEYVMPNTYSQQSDQGEAGSEIMKLKESLENNTKEYSEGEQSGFGMDFPDSQNKW